jgi:hypothetical protein
MSELIGYAHSVNVKSGGSTVTIFVGRPVSPAGLEALKILIKKWAEQYNVKVDSVTTKLKPLTKKKAKKK